MIPMASHTSVARLTTLAFQRQFQAKKVNCGEMMAFKARNRIVSKIERPASGTFDFP